MTMSTDDVPEHLIEAYESSDDYSDEHPVERILAALRPEDAHRVPAWQGDLLAVEGRLRGVANRLRLMCNELSKVAAERGAEVERLKAENERLKAESNIARPDDEWVL